LEKVDVTALKSIRLAGSAGLLAVGTLENNGDASTVETSRKTSEMIWADGAEGEYAFTSAWRAASWSRK